MTSRMSSTSTRPSSRPSECAAVRKFFRRQLLALPDHLDAAPQRSRRLLQQFPLPGPADQAALAAAKIILRETDQCRDQLRHAIATARRNLKDTALRPTHRPMADRPLRDRSCFAPSRPAPCPRAGSATARQVGQPQHEVRIRRPRPGTTHALLLHRIVGLPNAGGVDHRHRIAVEIELHLDDVARGAGMRRHDRDLTARELIHQRRLADIRRPGDRDDEAIAKPFAPPLPRQHFLDLGQQRFDLRQAPARSIPPARRPRPKNRSRPRSRPTLR